MMLVRLALADTQTGVEKGFELGGPLQWTTFPMGAKAFLGALLEGARGLSCGVRSTPKSATGRGKRANL